MTKIIPDRIITTEQTTGLITDVNTSLNNIKGDQIRSGTLRPDHLDRGTAASNFTFVQSTSASKTYTTTTTPTLLDHGGTTSVVGLPVVVTAPVCLVRSTFTMEVITGEPDEDNGDDIFRVSPSLFYTEPVGAGSSTQQFPYEGSASPGAYPFGLGGGLSRHNAGGTPFFGVTSATAEGRAYAEARVANHKTYTYSLMWAIEAATAGVPFQFDVLAWRLVVQSKNIEIGRYTIDLSVEVL